MLRTLLATQTRLPPEMPHLADVPPYQLPFTPGCDEHLIHERDGRDDHRQDRDDRMAFNNEGWDHRDN